MGGTAKIAWDFGYDILWIIGALEGKVMGLVFWLNLGYFKALGVCLLRLPVVVYSLAKVLSSI